MVILSRFSVRTTHAPSRIFARWADPTGWPDWDDEVRAVWFEGPAVVGARGRMKPENGPATTMRISAVDDGRLLTNTSRLPGALLTFEHIVAPAPAGSDVQVEVRLTGLLSPLWRRVLAKSMAGSAESSVTGLVAHLDAA